MISLSAAAKNELRKKFTHELSDSSDSKWWEYLIPSETKVSRNYLPLNAESVAFDVVQSTDDEIPDEEDTPIATTKSESDTKTQTLRPTTTFRPIVTTTESSIGERKTSRKTTSQQPTKSIQKSKVSQPAIKTSPRLVTTTASSLVNEDEEEELENNIEVKKPTSKTTSTSSTARKLSQQPTKTRPQQPSLPTKTSLPKVSPRIITTTTASASKSDEDEEELVVTKKPILLTKKPIKPQPQQNNGGIKSSGIKTNGGTKTKSTATQPRQPSISARPAITTTTLRSTTLDESDDSDDESLPTSRPIASKGNFKLI